MKNIGFFILLIFLSGCTDKYNYVSESSEEPSIIFGDRFGGGGMHVPTRNFRINTSDTNSCSDYKYIGVLSNNWMGIGDETLVVSVPKDTKVSLIGTYSNNTSSTLSHCTVGPVSFEPESSKKYSIDMAPLSNYCHISILEMRPDGTYVKTPINQMREEGCVETD